MRLHLPAAVLAAAFAASLAAPARAADSYDACTGFIDAVPATIATQGTWCLRRDLSTAIATGAAITIATNNVTLDCNGFKLGGLAAGTASLAYGVLADQRQNMTVRGCNIRGFFYGINLTGGAGHLVEDNRLDDNLLVGIYMTGIQSLARRNRIFDTGGSTQEPNGAYGIYGSGDMVGNAIAGVLAAASGSATRGIYQSSGEQVRDNVVSDVALAAGGNRTAIQVASRARVSGNHVQAFSSGESNSFGIRSVYLGASRPICVDNTISGFTIKIENCLDGGGNATN